MFAPNNVEYFTLSSFESNQIRDTVTSFTFASETEFARTMARARAPVASSVPRHISIA